MSQRLPGPTLFPYTTLFRSRATLPQPEPGGDAGRLHGHQRQQRRALMAGNERRRYAWPPFDGILRRRSEEHTSELQSRQYLVCRLLLEKKKSTDLTSRYEIL